MFTHFFLWVIMVIGFSVLELLLGYEDTLFVLTITILYFLIFYAKKLQPPPAREIFVPSDYCNICEKPRALGDLVPVTGSKEFPTGHFEWKLIVCADNKDCKGKALVEVERVVREEGKRREALLNDKNAS